MSGAIEKSMSITREEFERSLAALAPGARLDADGRVVLAMAGGEVRIRFEAMARRRLGGLISLPQARVVIDPAGMAPAAREAFLKRFDLAFQRGGG